MLDPEPAVSALAVSSGKLLLDNGVAGLLDGAVQLAGADIEPIESARPKATVTLPRPAVPVS